MRDLIREVGLDNGCASLCCADRAEDVCGASLLFVRED